MAFSGYPLVLTLLCTGLFAEPVTVRHQEGLQHGFLVVRSEDGKVIANGDLTQGVQGDRVTTHLAFHFRDGSLQEETAVYTQRRVFRLVSDHLVQKGPSFKRAVDMTVNTVTSVVTVRYDDKGQRKVEMSKLDLTPDLANGMVSTLLKNLPAGQGATLSMVVATPKPRLVKLEITTDGEDTFHAAGIRHMAQRFRVKIKLGGVAGVVAPIIGKQPADTLVWVMGGLFPAFVKSEGPFSDGGPIWRIELVSPSWTGQ